MSNSRKTASFIVMGGILSFIVIKSFNKLFNKNTKTKYNNENYVVGCGLTYESSILRNMHVMVDGDVVLCCDDATKEKTFGNVFKDGLLNIWNGPLKDEHELIFSNKFSKNKFDLICNNCSRAITAKEID